MADHDRRGLYSLNLMLKTEKGALMSIEKHSAVKWRSVNLTKRVSASLLGAAVALGLTSANLMAAFPNPQKAVNLGSAASFAVLAGTSVTGDPRPGSVINGDLGIYPGTSVTGFFTDDGGTGPSRVHGQIQDNDTPAEKLAAKNAQASLTIAMGDAAARPAGPDLTVLDNTPATALAPGVYTSSSGTMTIGTGGILYLRGKGVYIFQIATGLTVNDGASVVLLGGARAADIFWNVGSLASFGSTAAWSGTIMAGTAVTMGSLTTLNGRALAKAEVTLISNTITVPRSGK